MPTAIGLGVLGLAYGVVVTYFAIGMTGAGHGWMSASFSVLGILILPVFGVALAYRASRLGWVLMRIVGAAMLVVDTAIFIATMREGASYIGVVWHSRPAMLFFWTALWVAWQVAVVATILRNRILKSGEQIGAANVATPDR